LLSWRRLQSIGLSGRFPEDKGAIRNLSKPYPRHAIRNPELCHFWDLRKKGKKGDVVKAPG
jgi:hypothetical protein